MYKPPTWTLFEEVRDASPTSIIAMGTEDERTLAIVESDPAGNDSNLRGQAIERKLRRTYRNYQLLEDEDFIVDGRPAVRRTFRGVLDGMDWYGMAVHVRRDKSVFGIIGLTSAESFQFKQAVFKKIVRTFHFTDP